jgi:hypothetical protein
MQIGDKIKTIYGNVEEARITTFESFSKNSWYHPTKVFPVHWSETLEKYVSVPEDLVRMGRIQKSVYSKIRIACLYPIFR